MNIKNLEEKVGRIIIKFHHLEWQVSILDFDFKISSFKLAQLLSKLAGLLNILHRPPMRSFNLMWAFCDILVRKQCKCDDLDDHARAISNSDSILTTEREWSTINVNMIHWLLNAKWKLKRHRDISWWIIWISLILGLSVTELLRWSSFPPFSKSKLRYQYIRCLAFEVRNIEAGESLSMANHLKYKFFWISMILIVCSSIG